MLVKPNPLQILLQEEKGVFIIEEFIPWVSAHLLWTNCFYWRANPYIYWIDQCKHFYSNRSEVVKVLSNRSEV